MNTQQNDLVVDQFSQQAAAYAALLRNNPDASLRILIEGAQPRADDRVLDVGCGTGKVAVTLASVCQEVVGIDLTPAMLVEAEALGRDYGLKNVRWETGDVSCLPFNDHAFTLVTSTAMLHHTDDPGLILEEMCRVCAPGGRVVLTDLTTSAEKNAAFDAVEVLRDPSHVHSMTTAELRGLAERLPMEEYYMEEIEVRLPLEAVLSAASRHHR
jgi:ubiquinone/menaquinone biosynthesis C-methylase UbiE